MQLSGALAVVTGATEGIVAHVVVSSFTVSDHVMVSELDIRPTNP